MCLGMLMMTSCSGGLESDAKKLAELECKVFKLSNPNTDQAEELMSKYVKMSEDFKKKYFEQTKEFLAAYQEALKECK